MKAAVYEKYGSPEVLHISEVEKLVPRQHEVLVKVRAASVNPLDWKVMTGGPYLIRALLSLKPKLKRCGVDVAGEVEAIGAGVTQFKPGDYVFGTCPGAFAEYACTSASGFLKSALTIKPDNVTFEQAAAAPIAALTALQGLRDKGKLQPGHQVLIHGAAGGVGTFAVQIAKSLGAEVTGVCSTRNVDLVRSIGADRVIDYIIEDFTRSAQRYNVLLDCVGNHPVSACRRVLEPDGVLIMVGASKDASMMGLIGRSVGALLSSPFLRQKAVMFIAKSNERDLATVAELMTSGKVTSVIDRRYGLSEVAEALKYVKKGHARGKVVIYF